MAAIGCRKAVRNALRQMRSAADLPEKDKGILATALQKHKVFNRLTDELDDDYRELSEDKPDFLERVAKFLEWILTHREEIIAMITSIIAMFANSGTGTA